MEAPYFSGCEQNLHVLGAIRNSSFCVTKTALCTYLILFELDTRVITVNL